MPYTLDTQAVEILENPSRNSDSIPGEKTYHS
jgi:hypothetical protein